LKRTNSSNPARILVVEDHKFFRDGLVRWINEVPGLNCCGEADCGEEARRLALQLKPDLVTLDLELKDGDGLTLMKELLREAPGLRLLVIYEGEEDTYAERVLRAGGLGYLTKQEDLEQVLTAIHTILDGDLHLSRRMVTRLVRRYLEEPQAVAPANSVERLSDRELKVFELMGKGLNNHEISTKLGISKKTVDAHRESIKNKLGLPNAKALRDCSAEWVKRL
jgi:DNA-binding NarL/FixJ family response regulator